MQERDINSKPIDNPDNIKDEDQHREILAPFAPFRPYGGDDESKYVDSQRTKNPHCIENPTPIHTWRNDTGVMLAGMSGESGGREYGSRGGAGGGGGGGREPRKADEDGWKSFGGNLPAGIELGSDGDDVPPLRGLLALSRQSLENKQKALLKSSDCYSLEATLNNIRTTPYSLNIPAALPTPPVGSTDEKDVLATLAHDPALDEPSLGSSFSIIQGFIGALQPPSLNFENYSSCQMRQANLQALGQLDIERCMMERENLNSTIDDPETDMKSRPERSGLFHLGNDWVINTDLLFLERQRILIQERERVVKDKENWAGGNDTSSEYDHVKEPRQYWTKGIQIDLGRLYRHLCERRKEICRNVTIMVYPMQASIGIKKQIAP